MRISTGLFLLLAIGGLGGCLGLIHWIGEPLTSLIVDLPMTGKMLLVLMAPCLGVVTILGLIRLLAPKAASLGTALRILGFAAAGFGLIGGGMVAWLLARIVGDIGPVRLDVMAPTIAGGLLQVGLGGLIASVAGVCDDVGRGSERSRSPSSSQSLRDRGPSFSRPGEGF